jgi:hypothetical protein
LHNRRGDALASAVTFFRARRRFAVNMTIVNDEIERLDRRILV